MDLDDEGHQGRVAMGTRLIDRGAWRLLLALSFTLVATVALWLVVGRPDLGIDDAYIASVYGRNLAGGHGPVYTPGFERVEGFSSPAWMLVWALVHKLRPEHPAGLILPICIFLCSLSVAVLLGVVARLNRGRGAWLLVATLLATIPGFFAWNTLTLMDLSLWTAAIALFVGVQAKNLLDQSGPGRGWALSGILGLIVFTRPEGIALAPCFLVLSLAAACASRGVRVALRSHALPAVTVVAALTALFAIRMQVFGYPLPNTYYAKVSGDRLYNLHRGLEYSIDFLRTPWMALFAPLCLAVLLFTLTPLGRKLVASGGPTLFAAVCATVALMGLGLPLVEGGDHFGAHRLLQPFLLPAAVPAFYLLEQLRRRLPLEERKNIWPPLLVSGSVALAAIGFAWVEFRLTSELSREFQIAGHGRDLGNALNAATEPNDRPSVGVITAGGIALTYEGRVLDLMGLNWTAMAHSPGKRYGHKNHAAFHPDVFWTAPPELVAPCLLKDKPGPNALPVNDFSKGVLRKLLETERFANEYEVRTLAYPEGYVFAYVRRDWPTPAVALHTVSGEDHR